MKVQIYPKIKKAFTPPTAVLTVLTPLSALLLALSLGNFGLPPFLDYVSYLLSAYVFGALCNRLFPLLGRKLKELLSLNRLINLYMTDMRFHVSVGLYASQAINLVYAIFQFWLGVRHGSVWYFTMGFYYSLLYLMRVYLLIYIGRHDPGENPQAEWKKYRFCGRSLVVLNVVLTGMILLVIREYRYTVQNLIVAIAMATYTFAAFGLSVLHIFQYRRYQSPVFTASVMVSLVASLVSIQNLETTMLVTFGEADSSLFNQRMTGISGAILCAIILILSVYMTRTAGRELKALQPS